MHTITKDQFNKIPKDYKDVWDSDSIHGTNHNGKRTFIRLGETGGTCLEIEDVTFKIVNSEAENTNPIK